MDRSEPSLVPEWLKGPSGGSASSGHHIFSATPSDNTDAPVTSRHRSLQLQSSGATRGDYGSPRYSGSSERSFLSSRRSLNNNSGGSDRTNTERDPFGHSNSRAFVSFRRSSSLRVYESLEHEKDWEWGREWEAHGRERSLWGVSGNDRNNVHELSDTAKRWSNPGPAGRFESDSTLRRSQSVISNRISENGEKRIGNEIRTITAAPLVRGGIVSNMQKAAFEKDFPSLGAEEKQCITQSNLANVARMNSSSSPIWQGQGSIGRPGTPVSGVSLIDGWKSALADAPVSNGVVSLGNGLSTASQQIAPGSLVSSKGHGLASTSGLNMAEALVLNPSRPRTPQLSTEVQRMEVLALKQSRQLIPVTPTMPKTMGHSPSEKSKAKSLRSIDTTASAVKGIQSIGSSHSMNSPKVTQGGKLLVLKPARELVSSVSVKPNNGSPVKGGNTSSSSFGLSARGAIDVSGNASLVGFRKQKPLGDPRAVFSSGVDSGLGTRGKEAKLLIEEKKSVSQNRNDFFNALRRKACESPNSTATHDKSYTSTVHKADQENENMLPSTKDLTELKDKCSVENVGEKSDTVPSMVEIEATEKNKTILNGFVTVENDIAIRDTSETGSPASANRVSANVGSEEEEAAFLRSLGWEENDSGEEALTEEEISSFYREHMRTVAANNAFRRGSHRHWNLRFDMHVGNNVESFSSGIGSSESA